MAEVAFKKNIYGAQHPYGYETTETAIQQISQALLFQFYKNDLQLNNATLFIAGKYGTTELNLIEQYLGTLSTASKKAQKMKPEIHNNFTTKNKHTKTKFRTSIYCYRKNIFQQTSCGLPCLFIAQYYIWWILWLAIDE